MNKNLAAAKKIARDHVPHIIATASVATTVGVCLYFYKNYMTQAHLVLDFETAVKLVEDGGANVYRAYGQDFALTRMP